MFAWSLQRYVCIRNRLFSAPSVGSFKNHFFLFTNFLTNIRPHRPNRCGHILRFFDYNYYSLYEFAWFRRLNAAYLQCKNKRKVVKIKNWNLKTLFFDQKYLDVIYSQPLPENKSKKAYTTQRRRKWVNDSKVYGVGKHTFGSDESVYFLWIINYGIFGLYS